MDAISSLPDCLLHHILYFLKTKESVRTSVLSKRWIYVWKSVPRLDLDTSDFNHIKTFKAFGNSILVNHSKQLDTFILKWCYCNKVSCRTINTWISNLVSLKPKYVLIELFIPKRDELYFLSYLFNCATIETLDLWIEIHEGWAYINLTVVNLPCLKYLQLFCMDLNDEFIRKLILGCPVLEELCIEDCFLSVSDQKISFRSLKTLRIRNNEFSEEARLRISIPSLVELECKIQLGQISFENLETLEFASVSLQSMKDDYDGKEFKLLKGLSNAKSIELSGFYINNMLEKELSDLPVFKNLESLHLGFFTINKDLEPLASFLKHTPNLEKLTLRHVTAEKHGVLGEREINEIRCGRLKTVETVLQGRSKSHVA